MNEYALSIKLVIITGILSLLVGCAEETQTQTPSIDEEILAKIKLDDRIPEGFYEEERQFDSFSTYKHINNEDILPVNHRTYKNTYELSVDTYDEALSLALIAGDYSNYQMVDVAETEWFYQFIFTSSIIPETMHTLRVFKSSVINRDFVTLNCSNCFWGTINPNWLETGDVKSLIEYLWKFTLQNNFGTVVLESNLVLSETYYIIIMKTARLTVIDVCDNVSVFNTEYNVDKITGDITKKDVPLYDFTVCGDN